MPENNEYKLTSADSTGELEAQVNRLIKHGWRPIGGPVSGLNLDQTGALIQALVRYERQHEILT